MSNQQRPNIILVITDDQGYGDLGCTGNPVLKTPHIDAFYADSVRLTNFHVGPTCAPTRSGIMTGHYANSTGVWHTIGGRSLLRKDEVTIADALRAAGYRTGIFGKWHLGDNYPYRPQDRGFDEAIVHGGGGISQTPDHWGNDYFDDTYSVNGEPKSFAGYCTDVWFDQALAFIERHREQPFFCTITPNAPHSPYNVDPRYSAPYHDTMPEDRAQFYGMIANIDENFGGLRQRLGELGLEDNTILIFMTDNGSSGGATLDEQGFVLDGYNAGMRGTKSWQYEGGHRVPFFIRWPEAMLAGGRDVDKLTANVDMMPTLLDLCDVILKQPVTFHGQSLKPLLFNNSETWPDRVMVTDSQRLTNPVKWRKSAVMTDRWRLIDGSELYDLPQDPEQRQDVAAQYPDVVQQLRAGYDRWWDIVSVQFDSDIPISIGSEHEQETALTCHDWRNEESDSPWHQGLIRQGYVANGYWEIEIEQSGRYSFELQRWPRAAGHALMDGIEGDDVPWRRDWIQSKYENWYSGGAALVLTNAQLNIDRLDGQPSVTLSAVIQPGDQMAHFELVLEAGPAHIETVLTDGTDVTIGAYYVYVRRTGASQ